MAKFPAAVATRDIAIPVVYRRPAVIAVAEAVAAGSANMIGSGNGQLFVMADYLYVHPSFSQATAYVRQDLKHRHRRIRSDGVRLQLLLSLWCRVEVVLLRRSNPLHVYENEQRLPRPPFQWRHRARRSLAATGWPDRYQCQPSMPARWISKPAKTIPLGGQCCGCGDGCCDSCCTVAPAWDPSWVSGGVRWADVGGSSASPLIETTLRSPMLASA